MWQRIKNVYHLGIAVLANIFYGFPSRNLRVIGVTGTDGKTTTTSLIYHILHTAGYSVSMVSSIGAIIGGKGYDVGFHVTTPSPWALQRFLRKAVNYSDKMFRKSDNKLHGVRHSGEEGRRPQNLFDCSIVQGNSGRSLLRQGSGSLARMTMRKVSYLVLEVTSHAIDQNRIWGIPFAVGVLTNVTHEHLDYHKTYENYVKTKAKLLEMAKIAIVGRDDESYELIPKIKNRISKTITYGIKKNADVNPENFPFETNLIGEFNKYNILAAISACQALGVPLDKIRKGIENFVPPTGREDIVYKNDFTVMIDFAHTPNAFEQILKSIRPSIKGRLIHVFGAAGQRDASKRPLMGESSSKYADVVILTAEDPRSESVEKIMNEIEAGIMNHELTKKTVLRISDRKKAIEEAIGMAKKGDFVLFTGKSHEKSMNYGHGEVAWDEYRVVRDALKQFSNLAV